MPMTPGGGNPPVPTKPTKQPLGPNPNRREKRCHKYNFSLENRAAAKK